MSNEELEDALMYEIELRVYTSSIGRFIEGHMFVLHWPAGPDPSCSKRTIRLCMRQTRPPSTVFSEATRA